MTDLSKVSTADLQALASGDYSKVSTAGLQQLYTPAPATGRAPPALRESALEGGNTNTVQFVLDNIIKGVGTAAGTPGDVAYNLRGLGTAGVGRSMGAAGASAESLPQMESPEQAPFTSPYIHQKMREWGLISPQEAQGPRSTGEAIAGTGLEMLGGALVPVKGMPLKGAAAREVEGLADAERIAADKGALRADLDKDVALLTAEGVPLTAGQRRGGLARSFEEKAKSYPIIGDAIKEAERRGIEGFDQAVANRALQPLGEKAPKGLTGGKLIAYVGDKIDNSYETLLPKLRGSLDTRDTGTALATTQGPKRTGAPQVPLQGRPSFRDELTTIRELGDSLPDAQRTMLNHIIDKEVIAKFTPDGGMASGRTIKDIESQLGNLVRDYQRSQTPYDRQLSMGIREIQAALRRMVQQENPKYTGELAKLNEAWSNLIRLEVAGAQLGKNEELFTPGQYDRAVKQTDSSMRKRGYARGEAQGQDLAIAGRNRLVPQVPNSGTVDRAMLTQMLNPTMWPGMAIGPLMYSQAVQGALQRAGTRRTTAPMLPQQAGMIIPAAVPQVPLQNSQP